MFLYSDAADYSVIGDSSARILGTVPFRGSPPVVVDCRFDMAHYVAHVNFTKDRSSIFGWWLQGRGRHATSKKAFLNFRVYERQEAY